MVTSNFKKWIMAFGPTKGDVEAICGLYRAVQNRTSSTKYECSVKGNEMFIRLRHQRKTVRIAGDVAKETFLAVMVDYYCEGVGDFESWLNSKKE